MRAGVAANFTFVLSRTAVPVIVDGGAVGALVDSMRAVTHADCVTIGADERKRDAFD